LVDLSDSDFVSVHGFESTALASCILLY
jgi:hypothetical protein